MKTYIVEVNKKDIVGYFSTLSEAKRFCLKYRYPQQSILMLQGPRFGEGLHMYRLNLDICSNNFKKEMV